MGLKTGIIGNPVPLATATRVLYVGATGLLADSENYTFGVGVWGDNVLEVTGHGRFSEVHANPKTLTGCVTFIFDDGNDTDLSVMKPVFDAQGEVACSAIITDIIGTAGRLSWADLATLENAGWEIISHSKTHADLTLLNEAQIRAELADSKAAIEANGLTVKNFVYPYHFTNALVRALCRDYYRAARGNLDTFYSTEPNPRTLWTYKLDSKQIDDHTQLATYKAMVDTAAAEGRWVIFYLHGTDANDATAVDELIDYIQAAAIPIVTMNDALTLVGNAADMGDGFGVGPDGCRGGWVGRLGVNTTEPTYAIHAVTLPDDTGGLYVDDISLIHAPTTDAAAATGLRIVNRGTGVGTGGRLSLGVGNADDQCASIAGYYDNTAPLYFGFRIELAGTTVLTIDGARLTTLAGGLQVIRPDDDDGNILSIGNVVANYTFDFARSSTTGALSIQGRQTGYNDILLAPTSGNVGIGTTVFPSGGGSPVLSLGNAFNDPTGVPANTAGLVNKAGELYAFDAGGVVTLLSPHSYDGPPAIYTQTPGIERITPAVHHRGGFIEWVNQSQSSLDAICETFDQYNTRLGLTPDDLGYLVQESWDEQEQVEVARRKKEQAEWDATRVKYLADIAKWKRLPWPLRGPLPKSPGKRTDDYTPRPNPYLELVR